MTTIRNDGVQPLYQPKFRRSRTGCLNCKAGKHKCDETKPDCQRCVKASRQCLYALPLTAPDPTEPSSSTEETIALPSWSNPTTAGSSGDASHRPLSLVITPTTEPYDVMAYIFPDAGERELIQHFLCFGTINMCAIPQPDKPIKFLDLLDALVYPRGSSAESDALLLSLQSIGAVHRSSLFHQLTQGHLGLPVKGRWGIPFIPSEQVVAHDVERLRLLSGCLAESAYALSRVAMVSGLGGTAKIERLNKVLTSLVCVMITRSMLGETTWREAFEGAVSIIEDNGGPDGIIQLAVGLSEEMKQRTRSLLEDLTLVDAWRCLGSGQAPIQWKGMSSRWWSDMFQDRQDEGGHDPFHLTGGMERKMFHILNKVNMVVSEKLQLAQMGCIVTPDMRMRGNEILIELNLLQVCEDPDQTPRVRIGNYVLSRVLQIIIWTDVFETPIAYPDIQSAASEVIDCLLDSRSSLVVGMMIPTIVACGVLQDPLERKRGLAVISSLRQTTSYSYDVDQAESLVSKMYDSQEMGLEVDWREAIKGYLFF